jgi:hypothetical protein
MEEIGAEVKIGKLKYIREYIAKNHEFRIFKASHQVEFMFECTLATKPDRSKANEEDDGQIGIEWVDLDSELSKRIYPSVLGERIKNKFEKIYWGDVN